MLIIYDSTAVNVYVSLVPDVIRVISLDMSLARLCYKVRDLHESTCFASKNLVTIIDHDVLIFTKQ